MPLEIIRICKGMSIGYRWAIDMIIEGKQWRLDMGMYQGVKNYLVSSQSLLVSSEGFLSRWSGAPAGVPGGGRGRAAAARRLAFAVRVASRCNSPPRPVIWLGPSCHLCAAVARPSLASYRLETPAPLSYPAPPANRISSRRHCVPATLKTHSFLPMRKRRIPSARPPAPRRRRRPRRIAPRRASRPTLSLHFYHITTPTPPLGRRPRQTKPTIDNHFISRMSRKLPHYSLVTKRRL